MQTHLVQYCCKFWVISDSLAQFSPFIFAKFNEIHSVAKQATSRRCHFIERKQNKINNWLSEGISA